MYKLNRKEYRFKKALIKEVTKDPFLKYLASVLSNMSDMVMKQLLRDFTTLNQRMILLSIVNIYDDFANRWCADFENNIAKHVFPYISTQVAGTLTSALYNRMRKIYNVRGYTEAYLHEPNPKNRTEDHYLIVEQALSKIILELLILGEKGRYDSESFLLHLMLLCNVIKCTRQENILLKANLDEEGLRHLDGYLNHNIVIYNNDKRLKTCDSEPMIINFEDLPTNKGSFITDMFYPELKYYTNRMFVADYEKLLKLGSPKI